MTNLTRSAAIAVLLLAAAGCGDAESSEQQVVDEWCDALVGMMDTGDVALRPPDQSATAEQEAAMEAGERFYSTEPPPEVAEEVAVLRDGPPADDPMATQAASRAMGRYAQDNCEGLDPALFE